MPSLQNANATIPGLKKHVGLTGDSIVKGRWIGDDGKEGMLRLSLVARSLFEPEEPSSVGDQHMELTQRLAWSPMEEHIVKSLGGQIA